MLQRNIIQYAILGVKECIEPSASVVKSEISALNLMLRKHMRKFK